MEHISESDIPKDFLNVTGDIFKVDYPNQGATSSVVIIKSQKGDFVIKRSTGEWFKSLLRNEVNVLNNLPPMGILVPKIYSYFEDEAYVWCLMDYIKGKPLKVALTNIDDKEKKYDIIYNYGRTLGVIHSKTGSGLECETKWIEKKLQEAEFNMLNYNIEGNAELLEHLKKTKPSPVRNTLIHGDYTLDNVLVENGKIAGVIDWSFGGLGDPRYDVSIAIRPKSYIFQTAEEIDIFFEGYKGQRITQEEYVFFQDGGLYDFF